MADPLVLTVILLGILALVFQAQLVVLYVLVRRQTTCLRTLAAAHQLLAEAVISRSP